VDASGPNAAWSRKRAATLNETIGDPDGAPTITLTTSTDVAEPGSGFVTATGKLWPVCAPEDTPVAVNLVAEI